MRRMRLASLILIGVCLTGVSPARAQQAAPSEYPGIETGKMWTFDAPPLDYWARRYNFHPTQAWLDHARLSAARLPGCSASFVSSDGLVLSNHHCARSCIESASRPGEDLLENGFYARTRDEERACRGMYLDQLLSITDVTDSVNAAVPAGATPDRAAKLREDVINGIEERCAGGDPKIRCQVVTMYRGGQYKLYRFHHYGDLRLVFAVESQTGFFGGDPDNFTYPRYDLDVSIVRAYEDGQPVHTDYLRWSPSGARDSELVFVVGNPGSTGRLNTMAEVEYLRDVQYPGYLAQLANMVRVDQALSALSDDRAKALRNTLFGLQNSYKAIDGYQAGLLDPQLMSHKRRWEQDFRAKVDANPEWKRLYGSAWDEIAAGRRELARVAMHCRYAIGCTGSANAYGTRLMQLATLIVRFPAETSKPDSARMPIFQDAYRERLEAGLYSPVPVDTVAEERMLAAYFAQMAKDLPASDPLVHATLAGRTPEAAAREMVATSQILTGDQRRALVQGGEAAIRASTDPFLRLALALDAEAQQVSKAVTEILNRESQNDGRIARALLAVFGNTVAPDATFSLRISDGQVLGVPYNGTLAPPFTTMYGIYDRYYSFGASATSPWALAPRWLARRDSLNLATPIDAVSTNDIIGGNSGSPVINTNGELVGLIFDGNIEAQPLRFLFSEAVGRSVWVDSRGIVEALRRVYDAGPLADELTGRH
jgi:hypothetical protein